MELTLCVGEGMKGIKNGGRHNAVAAKENNGEVLRKRNCTGEEFYIIPRCRNHRLLRSGKNQLNSLFNDLFGYHSSLLN